MFVYEITPSGDIATCNKKESIPAGVVWTETDTVPEGNRSSWRIGSTGKVFSNKSVKDAEDQDKLNRDSRNYLTETDWYVLRLLERGVPIPTEISEARLAASEAVVE